MVGLLAETLKGGLGPHVIFLVAAGAGWLSEPCWVFGAPEHVP